MSNRPEAFAIEVVDVEITYNEDRQLVIGLFDIGGIWLGNIPLSEDRALQIATDLIASVRTALEDEVID